MAAASLLKAFRTADEECSGVIACTHLGLLMTRLDRSWDEAATDKLLADIPKKNGGKDVPYEDFVNWLYPDIARNGQAGCNGSVASRIGEVMATDEGRADIKAFFLSLDKDSNGTVSSKEWGSAVGKSKEIMSKYFGGVTTAQIGKAFKRIDVDGNKSLTWEEFELAAAAFRVADRMAAVMASEEGKAELKSLFDRLDKNSDGKVTSKEWGRAVSQNKDIMAKYFGGASMAEIGKAFKRINADGDEYVSWDEFEVAAGSLTVAEKMATILQSEQGHIELKAFFNTIDKNADGTVSSKEWGSAVGNSHQLMAFYFGGASKKEVGQAFKRIDANGDRSLSWDEFVEAAVI